MTRSQRSAASEGLLGCRSCGMLCRPGSPTGSNYCPRCGEVLESRRPHSVQIAFGLVIAAAICYLPANLLPVLSTNTLGSTENDTIIGGVIILYNSGSWPLALIVLIASVMIPLGKLLALGYLLVAVRRARIDGGHEQARLYRILEFIGRWSMLDVFVDAYTVALVQLHPLMSVVPGPGIGFFAAVVVLTMLATEYFDPRLIWDSIPGNQVRHAQ
jgi:paraquat-inducible protein A